MKKVLSFDIGGTNTRLALVNENLDVEQIEVIPTVKFDNGAFLASIEKLIARFDLTDVIAFGCGIPGV